MRNKKRTLGRPKIKSGLRNFKLSPEADKILVGMSQRMGWTMTLAVERALKFAEVHPDFNGKVAA